MNLFTHSKFDQLLVLNTNTNIKYKLSFDNNELNPAAGVIMLTAIDDNFTSMYIYSEIKAIELGTKLMFEDEFDITTVNGVVEHIRDITIITNNGLTITYVVLEPLTNGFKGSLLLAHFQIRGLKLKKVLELLA